MATEAPKYDVALSFAGEQRGYVEQVASALKDKGVKVFYDDYEKVTLWGKDLYTHLAYVYGKSSRYCVLFVSAQYAAKVWTNHERENAQARAISQHEEYVLPVRFDQTEVPGLRQTIGYLDLAETAPAELAHLISEKLGPRKSTPEFPRRIDRLTKALGVKGTKAAERKEKERIHRVAFSFYDALQRMSYEERKAILAVLAFGCMRELPEHVHVSLDLLSRMTKMGNLELVDHLGAVTSLGFKVRLAKAKHPERGLLVKDDQDVQLAYWTSAVPDFRTATEVAYWTVSCATEHFCADHGLELVCRLDFHRLSGEESGPLSIDLESSVP